MFNIYINDIRRAFVNGFKNKKKARNIEYELRQGSILIEQDEIILKDWSTYKIIGFDNIIYGSQRRCNI